MGYALKRAWHDAIGTHGMQFQPTVGTYPAMSKNQTNFSAYTSSHPTRAVVIGDLPVGCSEADVRNFIGKYGQVCAVRMVCNGQAAVVQFADISSSAYVVHMAKTTNFVFGTNRVRIEWATEINTSSGSDSKIDPDEPVPTRILHIDVAAADYPITVDVIRSICQPHGNLVRVYIGKRNIDRSLEVLVEFETVEDAEKAKEHLDGADIYSGCCSLTVTYSNLPKVHVTTNGPESWDFTGPRGNLPGPLGSNSGQRTLLDARAPPIPGPPPLSFPSPIPSPYSSLTSRGMLGQPPINFYPMPAYPQSAYGVPQMNMFTNYACPPQYQSYGNSTSNSPAVPVVRSTIQSTLSKQLKQVKILPTPAPVHQVTPGGIGVGHATSNLSAPSLQFRQADLSVFESVEGVVLMFSNLPPSLNCDHLFNLLCVYGNIARIKFLKSRPGCAMVQVGNAEAADFIHRYYNGIPLFGHTVQVHHSKQPELVEHDNLGTLEDGSPVMKNYMTDPNNRFRNSVVAAKSRILEPSRTIHFFNTPIEFSPEDVCKVFTDAGASSPPRVILFTTKAGQKTSLGLAEWDTLTEALEALVLANQRPIHIADVIHPFHLKLAFSPKPISADRLGQTLIRYPAPPFAATRPGTTSKAGPSADDKTSKDEDEDDETDNEGKEESDNVEGLLTNGKTVDITQDSSPTDNQELSTTDANRFH